MQTSQINIDKGDRILLYAALAGGLAGAALIASSMLRKEGNAGDRSRLQEQWNNNRSPEQDPGFMFGYPVAGDFDQSPELPEDEDVIVIIEEEVTSLDEGDAGF